MRLTIDDVKNAYLKTGLKPGKGAFINGEYACAVGVVSKALGGYGESTLIGAGYGRTYIRGIVLGFDGAKGCNCCISEERSLGIKDGRMIAAAVFAESGA